MDISFDTATWRLLGGNMVGQVWIGNAYPGRHDRSRDEAMRFTWLGFH